MMLLLYLKEKNYESLLAQDATEEDLELEMESSDVYRIRFTTMKLRSKKGGHDEEVRAVKTIAWMFRFIWNTRYGNKKIQGHLTLEEINQAKVFIFKVVQHETFQNENEKRISSLNAFRDETGLRLRSPISRRNNVIDFCFPIVLPAKIRL
ncbi:hypothetical protein JTB14_007896 [Gonioctena quinquepunctata]|nr:hypothetical protein JTB14_007896 [Gonioctena quinquepunctata]